MQDQSQNQDHNLLPYDGDVFYYPSFFSVAESNFYFERLLKEIDWRSEPVKIFGKEIMQPRLTAWFGTKTYSYSGIKLLPAAFPEILSMVKEKVEKISGNTFNSALLNLYRNGNDSMGWHRDNEKELGTNPVIASVSFGAARKFRFRDYKDKGTSISIYLQDGSLILMSGKTQHYWEHGLPKTAKKMGPRINITFRSII